MSFNIFRLEYALEGTSNFIARKYRMDAKTGVLEYTKTDIPKLVVLDAHQLAQWNKDTAKERRIILDRVRDHIISNLHGNETPFSMWKELTDIFENGKVSMKLALRDKLRNIYMLKGETIPHYHSRFT